MRTTFATTVTQSSFLEQVGPTLVAVVLTGAVGLASAWAGRVWERRSTHETWLRDRRFEVYSETMAAATAFNDLLPVTFGTVARMGAPPGVRVAAVNPSDPLVAAERQQARETLDGAIARLSGSVAQVAVLGPPHMIDTLNELARRANEAATLASAGDAVVDLSDALSDLAANARQALGGER